MAEKYPVVDQIDGILKESKDLSKNNESKIKGNKSAWDAVSWGYSKKEISDAQKIALKTALSGVANESLRWIKDKESMIPAIEENLKQYGNNFPKEVEKKLSELKGLLEKQIIALNELNSGELGYGFSIPKELVPQDEFKKLKEHLVDLQAKLNKISS